MAGDEHKCRVTVCKTGKTGISRQGGCSRDHEVGLDAEGTFGVPAASAFPVDVACWNLEQLFVF